MSTAHRVWLAGVATMLIAGSATAAAAASGAKSVTGAVLAQDAGQGGDPDGRKKTDVSELWELYPIDPADAGTPLPTPEPSVTDASGSVVSPAAEEPTSYEAGAPPEPSEDVPAEVGGAASENRDTSAGGGGSSGSPWIPWVALGAVALVAAGGGAAFAVRRSVRPSGDGSGASLGAEPAVTTASRLATTAPTVRAPARAAPGREHVRIHLHDGRRIEGWKKPARVAEDNRVIVLDVENVYDSSGRELATTPLDSFVLPPQVDHIESLD